MHEMVHIVHGHVEYMQDAYRIPAIGRGMNAIHPGVSVNQTGEF